MKKSSFKNVGPKRIRAVRYEENKNEGQKTKGFEFRVKVRVEEADGDGDISVFYLNVPSKVKIDKPGDYEVLWVDGGFLDKTTKEWIFYNHILEFVKK